MVICTEGGMLTIFEYLPLGVPSIHMFRTWYISVNSAETLELKGATRLSPEDAARTVDEC